MEQQKAIYDDESFFSNYLQIRADKDNYNDMIEQPAVFGLLGDVRGKRVLDIGCGYGTTASALAAAGAASVLGIDPSEKMVAKAVAENTFANVAYRVLAAEDMHALTDTFDVVVSCLALHYMENLDAIFTNIRKVLPDGGTLVFSMEHPIYTACRERQDWICGSDGHARAYILDHYAAEGERNVVWLGKAVRKYHHTLSTVFNALLANGFLLEQVVEPAPTEEMLARVPRTFRELHRPAYLLVRCRKV